MLYYELQTSVCYIHLFFSYTEVDPAVIAGDGVEMFKNEARKNGGLCAIF